MQTWTDAHTPASQTQERQSERQRIVPTAFGKPDTHKQAAIPGSLEVCPGLCKATMESVNSRLCSGRRVTHVLVISTLKARLQMSLAKNDDSSSKNQMTARNE